MSGAASRTQSAPIQVLRTNGGRAAELVLDAGRGNVIDSGVIAALRDAVRDLASERRLCAVLLTHTGEHFSYGASVPEHAPGEVGRMLPAFHALALELLALERPLLAAVGGACLGGGLELGCTADLLFASPSASFGQPEIALGVFAPLGSLLLPRRIGAGAAADLLLSGRRIDASEALRIGLARELAADPAAAARAWIGQHLVGRSAEALRHATRAARASWWPDFATRLAALERAYLVDLQAAHDAREGIAAFLDKRAPRWEDR